MRMILAATLVASTVTSTHAGSNEQPSVGERIELLMAQNRRSCKAVSNCRDVVIMWCIEGYAGADRDKDGIPCEGVCRSRAQVVEIMAEVGC